VELRARRAAALAALGLALALIAAAPALAAGTGAIDQLKLPVLKDKPPAGYRLTSVQAVRIASRDPKVVAERHKHAIRPYAYVKRPRSWQISYFRDGKELVQVTLDDPTGAVLESWNGPQVAWRMARGYEGAFAGKVNAPYVWLPLCALFLAPFLSFRRPFRVLHLDLAVLLAFGASHYYFNRADIDTSVPLVYPVLAYLLVRLLWEGFRSRRPPARSPHRRLTWVPTVWLVMGLIFLMGFRIALNVADSNVIDVGYAGAIGADRIEHGRGLYNGDFPKDNEHGDTYGPVDYLLYVPFDLALPWSGKWDSVAPAHGAAIFFDLMTVIGLLVLGRRLRAGPRGRALGVALAYAWAAFPYTLFTMNSNSNDTLVAAVLVWALVALRSPPVRGVLVGLGAAAKFVPLALAPLFATAGDGERRWRGAALFSLALAVVFAGAFLPFVLHLSPREVWDRTLGYQVGRDSPFSIWGQHHGLDAAWTAVKAAAVVLALLVAFVPRRKSGAQVAALGAAVLVAFQIAAAHWFYLYIVWFLPFALVAFFCRYADEPEQAPARAEPAERPAELAVA
jgi:hypothetical protein